MRQPSFFIVGAPKCGTTALYTYLKEHPDIYMPRKEVYFFGKDLHYRTGHPSTDHYHSLFRDASPDQLAGEASVWYLLSREASGEIRAYDPEARIIIMLRDPVEMVHALHFHQLLEGNETIEKLEEALEAEKERKKGSRLPPNMSSPYEALQYREVGKYKRQVERYLDQFGDDRVRIVLFEDFIRDPKKSYEGTLAFLGLTPRGKPSFEPINTPQRRKSRSLRDLLKRRPSWLIQSSKFLLPSRNLRQKLLERIERANREPVERPPMKTETRELLREEFRADVQALGEILGKDLEHFWWGPPEKKG